MVPWTPQLASTRHRSIDISASDLPLLSDPRLDPGSEIQVLSVKDGSAECLVKGPELSGRRERAGELRHLSRLPGRLPDERLPGALASRITATAIRPHSEDRCTGFVLQHHAEGFGRG